MRATLIIIEDGRILLIHRFRDDKEYYVFPGWWIEDNENAEMAAIREAREETNFDIKINEKLWEHIDDSDSRVHHVFLVTDFSGNLQLNGPEKERNCDDNKYILEWHNLDKISGLPIYPELLKRKVVLKFNN